MVSIRRGRPVAAALTACLGAAAGSSVDAKAPPPTLASHDGVYAVEIFTRVGACDRVYHWSIAVSAGRVTSPADGFMQASGRIDARGGVVLAFRRDNQIANVAGRVKGKIGSGTWSSPTLQCSGSWTALRQG